MQVKAKSPVMPVELLAAVWRSYLAMSDEVFEAEEHYYWTARECDCWRAGSMAGPDECGECSENAKTMKATRDRFRPALDSAMEFMRRECGKLGETSPLLPQWMNELIEGVSDATL